MEREHLDEQEAVTHLRRAARSSGRKLSDVAREVAAGLPLRRGQSKPPGTPAKPTRGDTGPPKPDA
jgi:ANTAR domain